MDVDDEENGERERRGGILAGCYFCAAESVEKKEEIACQRTVIRRAETVVAGVVVVVVVVVDSEEMDGREDGRTEGCPTRQERRPKGDQAMPSRQAPVGVLPPTRPHRSDLCHSSSFIFYLHIIAYHSHLFISIIQSCSAIFKAVQLHSKLFSYIPQLPPQVASR